MNITKYIKLYILHVLFRCSRLEGSYCREVCNLAPVTCQATGQEKFQSRGKINLAVHIFGMFPSFGLLTPKHFVKVVPCNPCLCIHRSFHEGAFKLVQREHTLYRACCVGYFDNDQISVSQMLIDLI